VQDRLQTEFDLPLLRVRTDDALDPPLEDVLEWIIDQTGRGRRRPD
jgi:hypothetical protein